MIVPCPVAAAAARDPRAPGLRFVPAAGPPPTPLDWAEQDVDVRRWQTRLRARGLRAGDRVALIATNHPAAVALLHAAARERVLLALINARLTAAELSALLIRLGPRLLLASRSVAPRTPGALVLEDEDRASASPAGGEATWDEEAPHTALFTSGTEGPPKGVVLQAGAHLASARASNALLHLGSGCAWLATLPLFHVGGLSIAVRCALAAAEVRLHERFDAAAAAGELAAGATHASLVAATLQQLLDARGPLPFDGRARSVLIGGGPVPRPLFERARAARLPVLQTYGLTEAASQVCTERPGEADGTTAGPPLPGTEVRIVAESGAALPAGAAGIVEVRGPTLLCGHLDGAGIAPRVAPWLRTGDFGSLDARGRLTVHARRNDLILSGGENVYPAEVEAVLLGHPAIAEAAVVPGPDPRWGQVPVAAVALRAEAADAELFAHCRSQLAPFKVPREFHRLEELPRLPAGKIDRRAVLTLLGLAPIG
jgi:O-succinylbenzoic acid--CoA ligase